MKKQEEVKQVLEIKKIEEEKKQNEIVIKDQPEPVTAAVVAPEEKKIEPQKTEAVIEHARRKSDKEINQEEVEVEIKEEERPKPSTVLMGIQQPMLGNVEKIILEEANEDKLSDEESPHIIVKKPKGEVSSIFKINASPAKK